MRLIVYDVATNGVIYQTITVGSHDIQLAAIRPHLIRYPSPSGNLWMTVRHANGQLISTSNTISIASIGSGLCWHGYQQFLVTTQLKANTSYRLQLESSGYTFSGSNYVSWCNDYDLRKVTASYSPNTAQYAALDLELWEYVESWRRTG